MPDDFNDQDERPTRPDGPQLCPQCVEEDSGLPTGRVLVTEWDESSNRHRSIPRPCPLCLGRKLVGRDTLERFKAIKAEKP